MVPRENARRTSDIVAVQKNINQMPKSRRRTDEAATLDNYERRMRALPAGHFQDLHDAWLETFEVYSAFSDPHLIDCAATRLMRVARERGVNVLGVVSARRTRGVHICPDIDGVPRERCKIVYVGGKNYFTEHQASPYALSYADKVFLE